MKKTSLNKQALIWAEKHYWKQSYTVVQLQRLYLAIYNKGRKAGREESKSLTKNKLK